jgi:hypothetical protein
MRWLPVTFLVEILIKVDTAGAQGSGDVHRTKWNEGAPVGKENVPGEGILFLTISRINS